MYKLYCKNYTKLRLSFFLSHPFYPIFRIISLKRQKNAKEIIPKKVEALYANFLFDQRRVNIEFNFSPISYTIYTRANKEQGLPIQAFACAHSVKTVDLISMRSKVASISTKIFL